MGMCCAGSCRPHYHLYISFFFTMYCYHCFTMHHYLHMFSLNTMCSYHFVAICNTISGDVSSIHLCPSFLCNFSKFVINILILQKLNFLLQKLNFPLASSPLCESSAPLFASSSVLVGLCCVFPHRLCYRARQSSVLVPLPPHHPR